METESKFLNKQYLETRLREFKQIKRKEIDFSIEESDRAFSRSIYINFYLKSYNGFWYKDHTLRISDHIQKDCPYSQFIVDPNMTLTKKKKSQFVKAIETALIKAKTKSFHKKLAKVEKEIRED